MSGAEVKMEGKRTAPSVTEEDKGYQRGNKQHFDNMINYLLGRGQVTVDPWKASWSW
jgi:hypothetical protein